MVAVKITAAKMRIVRNDTVINFPSSLSEITLKQRIDFYNEHGRLLDEMLKSIMAMPEGIEKDLELSQFLFEKMIRAFAFFSNSTVEAVRETEFLDTVANIYYSTLQVLLEEEENLEFQTEFLFNDEWWELAQPELKQGSSITFGEFADAKQLIKDAYDLGQGKWESMLKICAIFLRKKGEVYDESFVYEGSERIELMKNLPMDIALQVGFFLIASINISMNTLKFSESQELNKTGNLSKNTLKNTDG